MKITLSHDSLAYYKSGPGGQRKEAPGAMEAKFS